ncbi:hypothetical protein JCM11641_000092 [Rhodosporidiobolus odoratus]
MLIGRYEHLEAVGKLVARDRKATASLKVQTSWDFLIRALMPGKSRQMEFWSKLASGKAERTVPEPAHED